MIEIIIISSLIAILFGVIGFQVGTDIRERTKKK